jgi:predicted CopG family antitoxin
MKTIKIYDETYFKLKAITKGSNLSIKLFNKASKEANVIQIFSDKKTLSDTIARLVDIEYFNPSFLDEEEPYNCMKEEFNKFLNNNK